MNYEKFQLPNITLHESCNACNDVLVLIEFSLWAIIIFLQRSFLINIFIHKVNMNSLSVS